MDAYLYRAALYCGPCVIKTLIAEHKAAPAADDMPPAEALQQIVASNGFADESNYDSDDLPKGPYTDGGAEADTPQHCDACGVFLENPLTPDGYRYVNEAITEHGRNGRGDREVLKAWAKFYERSMSRMTRLMPADSWVIRNTETGRYVARSGSKHSYTKDPRRIRIFPSKAAAEAELCVENEIAIPCPSELHPCWPGNQ